MPRYVPGPDAAWPAPLGAAIAVALLVIAAISSHAQGPADVAAYRQLIDEYRAGRRVGDADISRLTSDPSLVGRIVEPTSGWSPVELTAAAMLHTDCGLLLVKKAQSARRWRPHRCCNGAAPSGRRAQFRAGRVRPPLARHGRGPSPGLRRA